jgi:hypothetical protein
MFGSTIFDVAIGMIFVYLLLSLICSAANELIEARLKYRAKDLELGIRNLLGDPNLSDRLYGHALVAGLFSKDQGKPSYIPSRTFSLALLNLLTSSDQAVESPPNLVANPIASIREAIEKLPSTGSTDRLKQALSSLLDDAQGDLDKFRKNVEDWYDAAMDRVSGWYKRRVHTIILILGLGISIALNADTSYVARHLLSDPALRNSLVAASQAYAQKQNPEQAGGAQGGSQQSPQTAFTDNYRMLKGLGLPLGWNNDVDDEHLRWPGGRLWKSEVRSDWYSQIRFHWLGWILTALAISLGAPFWFDMLNKFVVVRSTVKPKEKSPEEKSKN